MIAYLTSIDSFRQQKHLKLYLVRKTDEQDQLNLPVPR